MAANDQRLETVLGLYDPPAGTKLWHGGASALGSLRGVGPEQAGWKPAPDRKSIWELVLHIAYWKYAVWRRGTGAASGSFPRAPSNWPAPPEEITDASWKRDRALLREYHERLSTAMRDFDPKRLAHSSGGKGGYTYEDLFLGIVLHDTYHAGQIQMLKRLYASLG
jgi:uncharacterized damage-inducible protein DinB